MVEPHGSTHLGGEPGHHNVRAWRNSVYLIFALCGAGLAGIVTRIPTLRDDLGISIADMGFLLLGLSVGSVIGLVTSGHIVSQIGPRTAIVGSLLFAALGLIGVGVGSSVAHDFTFVLIGLVCFGFGFGVCNVAMNVEASALEKAIARPIMPLFHASFSIGSVAGSAIAALAAALHVGVIFDLTVTALLMSIGTVMSAPHLKVSQRNAADSRQHSIPFRAQLRVWFEKRTILIGLLVLSTSFAAGSGNDWLALAMVDGHDTSNSIGVITYGAFVAAGTIGRLAGVSLLSRFGRVAVLRGSAAVCVGGLLLFILAPNPGVAFIGAMLWGLGAALGFPVGMSAAADSAELAGARISAVVTIAYVGSLIGPPLIGIIGEAVGILNALLVVLAFAVVAAVVSDAARETVDQRTESIR